MATRTYGLSGSGMDIDAMVKKLMTAQRSSYTSMLQKKTKLEWKKADYNSIYSTVSNLRNTVFNYKMQSTVSPKAATSSSTAVVTATANADAAVMSHTITVNQLATGVNKSSTGAITTGANKNTIQSQFGLADASTFNITIANGTSKATITVDPTQTIYDLVGKINNAGINVRATYDTTLDRFFLTTTNTGSAAGIDFTSTDDPAGINFLQNNLKINTGATSKGSSAAVTTGTVYSAGSPPTLAQQFTGLSGSFAIQVTNGSQSGTVNIDTATDTMDSLVGKLNAAGVNVSATYNAATDRFSLKTTNVGATAGIDFTGSDAGALSFLQDNLKLNTDKLAQNGVDAVFDLDGVSTLSQATNSFAISGVNYSLQSLGSSTVSVSSDLDKTVANVKAFVEAYNSVLDTINDKLGEASYRDYLPLTDDQKSSMKDSEITAWEAKAKSGMLRHDPILSSFVDQMRANLYTPVSGVAGKYNTMASLGITTGDYTEGGKLYLDESKLREALQADPDAVSKVFYTDTKVSASSGVAVRLYDTLKTGMDKLVSEAGLSSADEYGDNSNISKRINAYTKQMSAMSTRLQQMEDRYYEQFDAMEAAIQKLNSQSAWLSQQFSSG